MWHRNAAQMISTTLTAQPVPSPASAFRTRQPRKLSVAASVRHDLETQKLRKATEADVGEIRQQLWRERMNPLSIKPENFTVVDSPQGIIAFAQLEQVAAAGATEPAYEFRSLVVSPKHRGQGIGSMLMQHIVSQCPHDIYCTTLAKTTPFYHKAGFRQLQASEVPSFLWFEAVAGTLVARLAVNDQLVVMLRPAVPR